MTPKKPITDADIELMRSIVIYEDDQVLALNKPAGLSSQKLYPTVSGRADAGLRGAKTATRSQHTA